MLQPLQLSDVSLRHALDIAELRDFLSKAGCPLETAGSLASIAARLPRDRAFHRDLTSSIWVVIDRSNRQISYSDLLGVLAIAAAGTRLAAAADEADAHALLRFLMEARHSLDPAPAAAVPTPAARPSRPVATAASSPSQHVSETALQRYMADDPPADAAEKNIISRKRIAWAAVCALLALAIGLWLQRRPVADFSSNPPATSDSADGSATLATNSSAPSSDRVESPAPAPQFVTGPAPSARARSFSPAAPARGMSRPAPYAPERPAYIAPLPAPAGSHSTVPTPTVASASPAPSLPAPIIRSSTTSTPATAAIPASTLSKRLDSQTISADAQADIATRKYPRLLRRQPATGANLVAESQPADLPAGRASTATPGPVGTVRPTSLGLMAGNILYSPTPAYPPAASAAHVQGEVRLRADVDRNGNVASATVISGPPLLRDAALEAIQHWRFRPYMSAGKPAPISAMAVMDFQLP